MSAAVRHQTGMGCCASTLSRAEDVRDLETGMILMNKQWIRCQDISLYRPPIGSFRAYFRVSPFSGADSRRGSNEPNGSIIQVVIF